MTCNTDMLSEKITKLFLVETFTYVKALLIASTFVSTLDLSVYMWQKSKYFCFTSLNRLLKTVQEVDDLSNSDKVKSTVTGSES